MIWNENPVLTVSQMYEADSITIKSGVSGADLMFHAGEAVAKAVDEALSGVGKVLVLCGPGNNGGDGFVTANILQDRGYEVKLFSLIPHEAIRGDALVHARQWQGDLLFDLNKADFENVDIIVDALFGAGLTRPLEDRVAQFSQWAKSKPTFSVDIPSGLSGDTGQVVGDKVFTATRTITFFRKKPGHLLYPGRKICGEVSVVDIGIKQDCLKKITPNIAENNPCLWMDKIPQYSFDKNKYCFGHSLIWGGKMTGAARLSSLAALRVGSGLVSVLCPEKDQLVYALTSSSLIVHALEGDADIDNVLSDKRINSLVIGPGGGRDDELKLAVQKFLNLKSRSIVLDADALSVFETCRDELINTLHKNVVLTPHEGEFKKIFPNLKQSKIENAAMAAKSSGGVIVLKGADTVIASPDGRIVINTNAPGYLAKAGAGDVLAGIIAGLLAQGLDVFEAACAGVWIHGEAASHAGAGMIADDLLAGIRIVAERTLQHKVE
ncbi:MAG: NAD(P)H-hydrate dehydratase [Halopseudomonas aestusnigri]